MIKVDPKMTREWYVQTLNVTSYSLKVPTNSATQINEVLDFQGEHNSDQPEESNKICHNIYVGRIRGGNREDLTRMRIEPNPYKGMTPPQPKTLRH